MAHRCSSMTRLPVAAISAALLLLPDVLTFALCPGEVANHSAPVSYRFTCGQPSLPCFAVLDTSDPFDFYTAEALCQRINGTVLELRDLAVARCFERVKRKIAPRAPFWLNIVEVNTPRCEGICPNFIDLRWASGLPRDVCLLRSKFARSCSREADPKFSCSQKGCCEVSIDHNPADCLLPTSHASGKLEFHKFAAQDNFAKIHGRRCAFVDASECPNGGLGNIWHLKLCDGANPQHEGCQPSENIRVACVFPKRPAAPSEVLLKSNANKKKGDQCLGKDKGYPDNAIFWIAVGALSSASIIILFQLIVWFRLRRQQASNTQLSRYFPRSTTESFISPTLEVTNPNFEESWSDEESYRPVETVDDFRRRLQAQDS